MPVTYRVTEEITPLLSLTTIAALRHLRAMTRVQVRAFWGQLEAQILALMELEPLFWRYRGFLGCFKMAMEAIIRL